MSRGSIHLFELILKKTCFMVDINSQKKASKFYLLGFYLRELHIR